MPHKPSALIAQSPCQRPHDVPLTPTEILSMAQPFWHCKNRVHNFDAVGFAQAIAREYGIKTYQSSPIGNPEHPAPEKEAA